MCWLARHGPMPPTTLCWHLQNLPFVGPRCQHVNRSLIQKAIRADGVFYWERNMTHTKAAIVLALLLGVCAASVAAFARECTCKDLQTIRNRAKAAGVAEEAWKEIHGWARSLRRNPPPPRTNKELDIRFIELLGTPRNQWDNVMSQAVAEGEEPAKIGGLNAKGEPVIDEGFQQQNCAVIIEAVHLHERTHKDFFLAISLSRATSVLMPSNLLWLRAESEVEAYRAEKEYLKARAAELEKKCSQSATATTPNGITYTATRCDSSPWGEWKLSVSGAMAGQGTLTLEETSSGGSWSATTTVAGVPATIRQTGKAAYIPGNPATLRLTTSVAVATVAGRTGGAQSNKSIDLPVTLGGQGCP